MRIAVFSANYLPHIGGIERFTDGLARELVCKGNVVTIVTSNVSGLPDHEEISKNLDIFRLPCHPCIGGRMPLPKRNAVFRRLWSHLLLRQYDGVLINARFYAHTLLGLRFAEAQGLRPVVLDHGSAYLTFGNPVLDIAVKAYEHVVTVLVKRHHPAFYGISRMSTAWLKTFGIEAEGTLSNAIDVDVFITQSSKRNYRTELRIPDDASIVAFVGRLVPEKGVACLLEAVERISKYRNDIHFVVGGDGPMRSDVMATCKQTSLLHMVGPLTASDVAALFLQADVVVLPSRSEGFSTTILEAAACGAPVISTDVGGARELGVDSGCGLLLEHAEGPLLADAICECIASDLKSEMGDAISRRVRMQYGWDNAANRVLSALKSASRD